MIITLVHWEQRPMTNKVVSALESGGLFYFPPFSTLIYSVLSCGGVKKVALQYVSLHQLFALLLLCWCCERDIKKKKKKKKK